MPRTKHKSVDDYIGAQPLGAHRALHAVRSAICKALPRAEEVISYKIPAYRINGEVAIYFAGWKRHYSVYPIGARLAASFKDELAPYEVNNKVTVRFPLSEPVPVKLIARIAKARAQVLTGTATSNLGRKKSKKKRGFNR